MHRKAIFLSSLFLFALLAPAVMAGTQLDPELTDPAGDESISRECAPNPGDAGLLCPDAPANMPSVDILAAWVSESNNTHYNITIETSAAVDGDTVTTVDFMIRPTAISEMDSMGQNLSISAQATGATLDSGPDNTTVSQNDTLLTFTFSRNATQAAGGDNITDLVITTSGTETATGTGDVVTATFTGTDETDATSRNYTLDRPTPMAGLSIIIVGGTIAGEPHEHMDEAHNDTMDDNSTMEDNGTVEDPRDFTGSAVNTTTDNATITWEIQITNTGTDPDDFMLSLFDPTGLLPAANVSASLDMTSLSLVPGEQMMVHLTAQLNGTPMGTTNIFVQGNSTRGAISAAIATIEIVAAGAPEPTDPEPTDPSPTPTTNETGEERESAIAGLSFLSPLAESMGLDDAFGEWAETVLLAIILLILILLIFLIIMLVGRNKIKVTITPKKLVARPGESAAFRVRVEHKGKQATQARAHFSQGNDWTTMLELGEHLGSGMDAENAFSVDAKGNDGSVQEGDLVIQVPDDAVDNEHDKVKVAVAPMDKKGKLGRAAKASVDVKVISDAPVARAGAVPLRMSSVEHAPEHPVVGQHVTTTATLENDSDDETLEVRVVLNVGGDDVEEQIVEVPPREARAVVFGWTVENTSSKVRVRVYPMQ